MTSIEIRRDVEVFDELGTWWNAQHGPNQSPFLRSEWFRTWAQTRLEDKERLHTLVVRGSEAPLAALPLVKSGWRLRSMANADSEVFDLVYDESTDEWCEALGSQLRRETQVSLDRVDIGSPLVAEARRLNGWEVHRTINSPFVDLTRGFGAVMDDIGGSLRRNLKRSMRRMESLGSVTLSSSTSRTETSRVLDEAFELEAKGWKGERGTAVANHPGSSAFYRAIAESAPTCDWLRLATLRVDGRLVAFSYNLEYANRMFGILMSHDETLDPQTSPGMLMLAMALESAAERGIESFELGGGESSKWKMRWTNHTRGRADTRGFGSSPLGWLARRGSSLYRRARSSARRFESP